MSVSTLTLIVSGVLILLYYTFIHVPREQKKRYNMKLGQVHDIYRIMNDVLRKTNAERFLILESRNGKGVPRIGTQLYVSVLYEDYNSPFESVKKKYQRLEADGQYIRMLKQIYDNDDIAFFTHDMPDGLLKDIYVNEGVFWSYVFRIGQGDKSFLYGSIATSQPESPFSANSGVNASVIRIAVNELRMKYKKYNETLIKRLAKAMYF